MDFQLIDKAKQDMEYTYQRWSMADPLYEEECWSSYHAAAERYNAMVAEAWGTTGKRVVLPWLQHVVA